MKWRREDLKLPLGWWWLRLYRGRVFQLYDGTGTPLAMWIAIQYDPKDRQFAVDGCVADAVNRGTAREIKFSLDDIQQIGAEYLEHLFDSEN